MLVYYTDKFFAGGAGVCRSAIRSTKFTVPHNNGAVKSVGIGQTQKKSANISKEAAHKSKFPLSGQKKLWPVTTIVVRTDTDPW
jgi:hypothetical protein